MFSIPCSCGKVYIGEPRRRLEQGFAREATPTAIGKAVSMNELHGFFHPEPVRTSHASRITPSGLALYKTPHHVALFQFCIMHPEEDLEPPSRNVASIERIFYTEYKCNERLHGAELCSRNWKK